MKEKIENLTAEQDALLEKYYEKWLKIGLQSRPTTKKDREITEKALRSIYKNEGWKDPKIVWFKSPFAAVEFIKKCGKYDNLAYADLDGTHDANWVGFYEFFKNEVGLIEETKEIDNIIQITNHAGWIWCFEKAIVCSEMPIQTNVNEEGNLHNFNGPAIEWADGEGLYYFNNVKVSKEIALKETSKITKKDILSEENVDIRREIIRKVGIEKAIEMLDAKTIHKFTSKVGGKYELLQIDYDGKGSLRPYLKMKSKSIDAIHIEGIAPSLNSVEDAICFRNKLKKFMEPEFLS